MPEVIVLEVDMNTQKCRSRALEIAAKAGGVSSVALAGDGSNHLIVGGNGIDSCELVTALKKKLKHARIVRMGEANDMLMEQRSSWNYYQPYYHQNQHDQLQDQYNHSRYPQYTNPAFNQLQQQNYPYPKTIIEGTPETDLGTASCTIM